MLFQDEKILIYHPGKCGGTTIEHLFLRPLRNTGLAELLNEPCYFNKNNKVLTKEWLDQRVSFMLGFISKDYEVNGVSRIYLQHADIEASIRLHGKAVIDTLLKITFVRNPFPRILSAFYYNRWDQKSSFEAFVLQHLPQLYRRNEPYTINHFGPLYKFTHYDGVQYVDFLGKLENIAADVAALSQLTEIPLDLSREWQHCKTVSGDIYAHYSEAYSEEMVDLVAGLYRKDFDLFAYTFARELAFCPRDEALEKAL